MNVLKNVKVPACFCKHGVRFPLVFHVSANDVDKRKFCYALTL